MINALEESRFAPIIREFDRAGREGEKNGRFPPLLLSFSRRFRISLSVYLFIFSRQSSADLSRRE